MVADENYFATVLFNSPFCRTHENFNFVHVQVLQPALKSRGSMFHVLVLLCSLVLCAGGRESVVVGSCRVVVGGLQ